MILKIKSWCEGIIIAIIICIIIESLIPEGNNKKYIRVIIGIYIMFVTLNPILNILNYDFDIGQFLSYEYEATYSSLDNDIKEVYVIGIQENIKSELISLGYDVKDVKVFVDINYENIEKIELKIEDNECNNKVVVEIDSQNSESNNNSYEEIINYLKENYLISQEKIIFK